MCKNCTVLNTLVSTAQRLHEMPQLHGRKFTEAVLHLALGPLQEDPARGAMPLAAREVQPPSHRSGGWARGGVRADAAPPPRVPARHRAPAYTALLRREGR